MTEPHSGKAEWIATTQTAQWRKMNRLTISSAADLKSSADNVKWDVEVQLDTPLQTIEGFGACFNELGWTSLSLLRDEDKEGIMRRALCSGGRRQLQRLPHTDRCK